MKICFLFTLNFLLFTLSSQAAFAKKQCIEDYECNTGRLCHASKCVKLTAQESLLQVVLAEIVPDSVVFIDDIPMGGAPWEGIVSAGSHAIRVEAPGYETLVLAGEARPQMREVVQVQLVPLQIASPQPTGAASHSSMAGEDDSTKEPGLIYIAALGGGGYGTAMWGDSKKRPAGSVLGGGSVGALMLFEPVWIDLGVAVSYGAHFIRDWPYIGDERFLELHLGVLPRVLFPVVGDVFYLGFEAEVGAVISHRNYFYVDLRGDLAFLINKYFELRINPVGAEWLQEAKGKGAVIGYTASAGVAVRFP